MCVTNFVFLQFSGPRLWYALKHHSHGSEDNLDCIRDLYAAPEGNRSLLTVDVYHKKWVQNITFFFHCNSRWLFEIIGKKEFQFTKLYGR